MVCAVVDNHEKDEILEKGTTLGVARFANQVHNYLKATGHRLGLLVNFGHYPKLEWERVVR